MKRILIISAIVVFGFVEHQVSTKEVISNYEKTISKVKSIDYDIDFHYKPYSSDDTKVYDLHCSLIKDTLDTIFGGHIWIAGEKYIRYYDLENIFVINHEKEEIRRYDAHSGELGPIKGHVIGSAKNIYFFNSEQVLKNYLDSTTNTTLRENVLKDDSCYQVSFRFADDPPFFNESKHLFINKQSSIIHKITYSATFQGNEQYEEWNLSNIQTNVISEEDLKQKFEKYKGNYTMVDYERPPMESYDLLKKGLIVPEISGVSFQTGKQVKLSDYRGEVVVLDFWYRSCFPCLMAIPHLSHLDSLYRDQGLVVLGYNAFDNNEAAKKKLPQVIEANHMSYPTIFVEREQLKPFNVKVFPSIYVVDREGKIVYTQLGYSEESETKIDSVLTTLFPK